MEAFAFAKVNLGLRVGGRRDDGFHPLRGLFQSISLADRVRLEGAEEDAIASPGGGPVVDGERNLAWRAATQVRAIAGATSAMRLELGKRIPVAAGLGGGSADAAAALILAGRRFGVDRAMLDEVAPRLGSDVPFCLVGGLAAVTGRGEAVSPLDPAGAYAIAVVVPPVELSTPEVYRTWDDLGGPVGPPVAGTALPPALRGVGPLANDLYPAAVALAPHLDDWRHGIAAAWGRPVAMSGSGPSLYAFFVDLAEAFEALDAVPAGARAAEAVEPVPAGWIIIPESADLQPGRGGHLRLRVDGDSVWDIAAGR